VSERSWPRVRIRPRAGSDPVLGRERPDFTDGAAQLLVEVPYAPPGSTLPRVDVHWGERHHAARPWAWVAPRRGLAGREPEGANHGPVLIKLMVSLAACKPICVNQVMRTTLLATMPTLDDVDIATVQRGSMSCGVAIPGTGGLGGVVGDRGRGGGTVGGGPVGGRGGGPAGGGGPVGGSGPAPALSKGKEK
jgi:hypothetical protein